MRFRRNFCNGSSGRAPVERKPPQSGIGEVERGRSRVKRANSSGKDERSEFLTGEEQNKGSYQSGQMGQTVNLLAYAFGGSNPSLPTKKSAGWSCRPGAVERRCEGGDNSDTVCFCGSSSVDRASAFQAEGREFEPRLPLQCAAACDTNASVQR